MFQSYLEFRKLKRRDAGDGRSWGELGDGRNGEYGRQCGPHREGMGLQLDVWGKGGVVAFGQAEEFHLEVLAVVGDWVFAVDAPESA